MNPFYVQRDTSEPPPDNNILRVGDNLITGETDFAEAFAVPSSLESDLLLIASSVFAVDRASLRGEREEVCRNLQISIPVINYARLAPLVPPIEKTLYHLSNDAWTINLRQQPGIPEERFDMRAVEGKTLLFSGGLDSLAAAIEFGAENRLQLVSHITKNRVVDESQISLHHILARRGYDLALHRCFISSRTGGPSGIIHAAENSQRTRSFLFLILAALMARRSGHHRIIYIAENGQMAIHLPLTHGRIGAFSTHTAHPEILIEVRDILRSALNIEFDIENPYVHKTKSEVVRTIFDAAPESIPIACSCWRSARLPPEVTHCGGCIPCLIRKIAIEYIGEDNTRYNRDAFQENIALLGPDDDLRRNLFDLAELVNKFYTYDDESIMSEWPELYNEAINSDAVISMYRRFSNEAREVLSRYPLLGPLLV